MQSPGRQVLVLDVGTLLQDSRAAKPRRESVSAVLAKALLEGIRQQLMALQTAEVQLEHLGDRVALSVRLLLR